MIDYDLKKNFVDEKVLKDINFHLTSNMFGWFVQPKITDNTIELYNFCLSHTFFEDNRINSDYFIIIKPLIDKIKMSKLFRLKANLYPRTDRIIEHGKHIDYDVEGKTALFYVNSNDGFTNLNDEIKIKSIANNLVTFDNLVLHNSSTCTNEKYRLAIVINYKE